MATTRPTTSASVEKNRKYAMALPNTRPTVRQVRHAGDAGDDGQEDHRGDDHLDQLDEGVAQRLERLA